MEMTCPDCGMCETHGDMSKDNLDEACWKGYHKEGNKKMFGKTYPNCVKNEDVTEEKCPHCSGPMFSEMMMNEKQDACYYKVKSRYKVWPSAYASGALVQCRKKGAKNWGNKSESIEEGISFNDDDWYEIDPKTMSIVNSYGPQSFRNAFGDSQIKLPNGNIVVKGLRAKYMDLDTKKSIGEAVAGLELADVLYNGLEQKYPDVVRQFGAEVVANAVMDAVEDEENFHSMSDVDLTVDEIYSKLAMSQDQGFDKEEKVFESRLYYNVIGTSSAELRKEFGMRKDRNGWFLTADSGKARVMEAQRAFGTPKML
jgi:hypothetical protein